MVKLLASGLFLTVLFGATAVAATFTAASCAESDVAKAVAQASTGDTVMIPSCPSGVSWTTGLTVTTAITLLGQGPGNTVLIDDVPKNSSTCQVNPMIVINVTANQPWRLGEFTLQGDTTDSNGCNKGHIAATGGSHAFRIDDITFNNMKTIGIRTYGDLWGVIDHCNFNSHFQIGIEVWHTGWGGVSDAGDNSWAQPSTMGTAEAVYIEDNTFTDTAATPAGCFDSFGGGRLVFRHNTCPWISNHGTESPGRIRGARQFEIYDNTFTPYNGQSVYTVFQIRGGTGVIFNNTVIGKYYNFVSASEFRDSDAFAPWGANGTEAACDGTGAYDNNSSTIYASGTYNGTSGVADVMTDTTQNWSTNQWTGGYSIHNMTEGWGSAIKSNTSNTVTTLSSTYNQSHKWNAGDKYEILSAYPCIDQAGRGQGIYLSGDTPTPTGWVKEILQPIYTWGNTLNGVPNPTTAFNGVHIKANRDFYDATASFDGTSGVGTGLLSARPSTCTPYVAYWATDKNTLYQCSATNTWTVYYTPYTYPYPYPLTQSAPPTPPADVHVTGIH